jgi:hypothetical protein
MSKTAELTDLDKKLLKVARALYEADVITLNPYSGSDDYGEPVVYRARLFTESERATIRKGLRKPKSGWECIPGGAGLMDEFEMVQFESNGMALKDIKRRIGR